VPVRRRDSVRVVKEQRRAELSEKSGSLASQLGVRDSILYALNLRRRCWYRENYLGPPKRRPRVTFIHLLPPKRISVVTVRIPSIFFLVLC
jgi:hypothetical protein